MATIRVSGQAQLDAALKSVKSGDTILLSAGTYKELVCSNKNFSETVTIASADPSRPAVINNLMVRNSSNIEINDLKFDDLGGKNGAAFWVDNSRHITIDNAEFEGHEVRGFGVGIGLRVKNCEDVTVVNSELSNFQNGIKATNTTNMKVLGNDLSGMSNDGMVYAGMRGMLIEGNRLHDMESPKSLKHKDGIQFYTGQGSLASHDIVIRGNTIENAEQSHGIFFTNTMVKEGDLSVRYTNLLIEDNTLLTGQSHGITVSHATGVTIRDNVVLQHPDLDSPEPILIPRIHVSYLTKDVLIEGNTVASVPTALDASWTVAGNKVGPKKYQQWLGDYGHLSPKELAALEKKAAAGKQDDAPEKPIENPVETPLPNDANGDAAATVRITRSGLDQDDVLVVDGLDFLQSDLLVLKNFARGTFVGAADDNPLWIWERGSAVKIDSIADLAELDLRSRAVDVSLEGEMLFLEIWQGRQSFDIALIALDGQMLAQAADLF